MFYLKKLSTTTLMVTTLMGSGIHFAYAMEHDDETTHIRVPIKVPFSDIKVIPTGEGLSLLVSVEEKPGRDSFRLVESSDEAEELIKTLTTAYKGLPEGAKIVTPPTLKIYKREGGRISFKEQISVTEEQKPIYRYLSDKNVNNTLQTMLEAYKQEEKRQAAARQAREETERRAEQERQEQERQRLVRDAEQARQAADQTEQERLVVAEAARLQEETIKAQTEALKMQQDIANAKALLAKQQQEQAEAALKQQQDEIAALQAQLVVQAEIARWQEKARVAQQTQLAAQQVAFAKQQEEAQAAHQAQLAAQQAEFAKQQKAKAAAAAAQQKPLALLGGRTPERAVHNINTEADRLGKGIENIISGKKWKHGRHKKKK